MLAAIPRRGNAALRALAVALPAAIAALALVSPAPAASAAATDPCPRSRELHVGPAAGLFSTVAPFEHFGSNRTQVFPATCTLAELAGPGRPTIAARRSPADFTTPYIATTRARGQL